jgi:uncharacterized protein DUF6484
MPVSTALFRAAHGAIVGTLAGLSPSGGPLVAVTSSDQPISARSCVRLGSEHIGSSVVMVNDDNDPDCPIIVGVVDGDVPQPAASTDRSVAVRLDGERVVLSAAREIVLECGKASITLTHAGKIIIRGAYVSSHSHGVNRIKGGTVEIN